MAFALICSSLGSVAPVYATEIANNASDNLIENMQNIKTIDFDVQIDFETNNEEMNQSITAHADYGGKWDMKETGQFKVNYWSNDEYGQIRQGGAMIVMTPDRVYASEEYNKWYYIEKTIAEYIQLENIANTNIKTDESNDFIQKLFDEDIIEYTSNRVTLTKGVPAIRYSYTVNTDNLLDLMIEESLFKENEIAEARVYLSENLEINGYFWVDTIKMLPVKFTVNIENTPSRTSYTKINALITVNSFNQPLRIVEPQNANYMRTYYGSKTGDALMFGLENGIQKMDTDGDGLMNENEIMKWHSDPLKIDTDGDEYSDKTEVTNGYNPAGPGKLDSDRDGLTDYAEMTIHWTDPHDTDSDNDGYSDGVEVANGYDPNGPGRF